MFASLLWLYFVFDLMSFRFDFMDMISLILQGGADFFEKRVFRLRKGERQRFRLFQIRSIQQNFVSTLHI